MDILLKITGTARTETEDTTETLTRGTFYRNDGALYFFYDGSDDETPELITNHRITVKGDRVEVQKRGAIQTKMVIAPGELNQCDYATPFGILRLDFYGTSVDISETPECVRIAMNYEIRIDGTVVSENDLVIEATPGIPGETMAAPAECATEGCSAAEARD
ncbi:MAG: DUF1934 domain-containing protein [Lachnospiraceae bacterium]|nr:DUF1934 domain-containing protein [Lachnospiraceae bacterium]